MNSKTSGGLDGNHKIHLRGRCGPQHAVAELSDGQLYVSKTYVKASGGCSAPAGKNAEEAQNRLGKMRYRQFAREEAPASRVREAQIMVTIGSIASTMPGSCHKGRWNLAQEATFQGARSFNSDRDERELRCHGLARVHRTHPFDRREASALPPVHFVNKLVPRNC